MPITLGRGSSESHLLVGSPAELNGKVEAPLTVIFPTLQKDKTVSEFRWDLGPVYRMMY